MNPLFFALPLLVLASDGRAAEPSALAKSENCLACHATDKKLVGPSFMDIARKYSGQPDASTYLATRIRAGGSGVWGQIPMPPNPQVSTSEANELANWILTFDGATPPASTQGEIDIIEFYNAQLGHYFITNPAEAEIVDQGGAGPGWSRTGNTFKGRAESTTGYNPSCRFYTTGANSHFYAAEPSECEYLKSLNPANRLGKEYWTYEGIAFYTKTPINGACPDGSDPIYRLYNNRASQNDSNHRYASSPTVVSDMQRRGWILEGTAMCSPQTVPPPPPPSTETPSTPITPGTPVRTPGDSGTPPGRDGDAAILSSASRNYSCTGSAAITETGNFSFSTTTATVRVGTSSVSLPFLSKASDGAYNYGRLVNGTTFVLILYPAGFATEGGITYSVILGNSYPNSSETDPNSIVVCY